MHISTISHKNFYAKQCNSPLRIAVTFLRETGYRQLPVPLISGRDWQPTSCFAPQPAPRNSKPVTRNSYPVLDPLIECLCTIWEILRSHYPSNKMQHTILLKTVHTIQCTSPLRITVSYLRVTGYRTLATGYQQPATSPLPIIPYELLHLLFT
jgi:hypothetical protein